MHSPPRKPCLPAGIGEQLREHDGYRAIQGLPGVGQILAAIFVAEIDVATRFAGPERFVHMARMDTTAPRIRHRGNCGQSTKQGSKLVRWATVEAIQRKTTAQIAADRLRVEARRGESIAEIDAARKLLAVVYCGLAGRRDQCVGQGTRWGVVVVKVSPLSRRGRSLD
ncbi:IS110 family transposase [Rhodococcus sp. KBS0724]|uniref:transposase n=1 Tax=Rhodococcus sp. KBS0724 TaxID=1179674 RepID=UPI00110F6856|nr:IS110 family transposase [Rhodococcus sp. KBS0724]